MSARSRDDARFVFIAHFLAAFFPVALLFPPSVIRMSHASRRFVSPSHSGTRIVLPQLVLRRAPLNRATIVNPRRHRPGIRAANDAPRKIGAHRIATRCNFTPGWSASKI